MKKLMLAIGIGLCLAVVAFGEAERDEPPAVPAVRFEAVDVYVDPGGRSLAAYQFELKAEGADVKIVGIEGGEHAAFKEPPYYDPAALMQDRVIIAGFDTGHDLPRGRTRVATVHLRVDGAVEPDYRAVLQAAATDGGEEIDAEILVEKGEPR